MADFWDIANQSPQCVYITSSFLWVYANSSHSNNLFWILSEHLIIIIICIAYPLKKSLRNTTRCYLSTYFTYLPTYVPTYLEPLIVTFFPFSFYFLLLIFTGIPPKSTRNKGKKTPFFFLSLSSNSVIW
jgi:hypothetical protein